MKKLFNPKMTSKVYPYTSEADKKPARERDLLSFLRNAQYYIERQEVCVTIKKRIFDKSDKLQLLNPDMLVWKKHMMPLFVDWLISNEHSIKDDRGGWHIDQGDINASWCELNICSRHCLVDYVSRRSDMSSSLWSSKKVEKYNYMIIIDPYYIDGTDDEWDIEWIG
jgi:hypothetical protein